MPRETTPRRQAGSARPAAAPRSPENRQQPHRQKPQRYEAYGNQHPNRAPRTRQSEQSPYLDRDRYRNRAPQKKHFSPLKPLIAAAALAVCIFGAWGFAQAQPVTVTVNGTEQQLDGNKDLATIIEKGYAAPKPGDFIAVDGSVLEAGKGEPFTATVNGETVSDENTQLTNNATVEISDGGNITENAQNSDDVIPVEAVEEGTGAIHRVTQEGHDGVSSTMTGEVSGKTVTKNTQEMQPRIYEKYNVDTKGEKVICLTFDDGPWPGSTELILDALKKNDAKATFFTLGERTVGGGIALLKREADEGHQVCSHSFDHARGSGKSVDMSLMTPEEQVAEVQKGQDAIAAATGVEASKAFRAPGGNFPLSVWQNVESMITAELGWNIDSSDWRKPGAEAIADNLMNVSPGDVILCHDGGGDRSQTVEALNIALPKLKAQGYRFITIDELMNYPAKPRA